MKAKSRYGSIIYNDNKIYLFLNEGNTHFTGFTRIYRLDDNFKVKNFEKIFREPGHISHNLYLFKGKEKNNFYGIGGKNRNQKPWDDHLKKKIGVNFKIGVYLIQSNNLVNWEIINNEKPIIYNNYPKNGVTNFEEKYPLFDGKICCLYSKILKKYILYSRANIQRGIRFVQYTTSNDLINWSNFNLIKSDYFNKKKDNYYTFDCIEIIKLGIFFAIVPFTNDLEKPSEYSLRKLISIDGVNWKDIGKLFNGKEINSNNKTRVNTHVCGMIYKEDENKLLLFIHHNYNTDKNSINLYKFEINHIIDLHDIFINNINDFYVLK